jgi:hypothetical protein
MIVTYSLYNTHYVKLCQAIGQITHEEYISAVRLHTHSQIIPENLKGVGKSADKC